MCTCEFIFGDRVTKFHHVTIRDKLVNRLFFILNHRLMYTLLWYVLKIYELFSTDCLSYKTFMNDTLFRLVFYLLEPELVLIIFYDLTLYED